MKSQHCILFYCQHSLGMGHLIRALTLASDLSRSFRVVFLNGGRLPDSVQIPDSLQLIDLPSLEMDADSKLVNTQSPDSIERVKQTRKDCIQTALKTEKPDVILVELFPFGRKKFAFELLPLLREAKKQLPKPVVVCSLRDILVTQRDNQQYYDDRARWLADRYFDAVLVHSDPVFSRLDESFKPQKPLKTPVFYTGFITREPVNGSNPANSDTKHIIVSAGGGIVGSRLFRSVIAAYPYIQKQQRVQITIVAGPFLPESEWDFLQKQQQTLDYLTLMRSVPDLRLLLQDASASISQCGYNTTLDLLQCGIPSLVVPFSREGENEQQRRAEQLAEYGLVKQIAEPELHAETLAAKVLELLQFKPVKHRFQLDGVSVTKQVIADVLAKQLTGVKHGNVA
ncbi:MAG: hypothetical protein K0U68_16450 [Gammaproteobacteria bacterium]|nr:hypothetical protein [Gammaproteobacteria bacterium]